MAVSAAPARKSDEIVALGLGDYVMQLEVDGLCVVPPEVTGLNDETVDALTACLLQEAEAMVGCAFTLDRGPHAELVFDADRPFDGIAEEQERLTQFLIQQLGSRHRLFRDLAVNPVAVALIRQLIGHKATRFSSHNAFLKWQGDFGYGPSLGMHADQMAVPLPWGRGALTANTNWCLTDYTLSGGALAYVPGSHRFGARPTFPDAVKLAVPVEAPRGSVIVFHGATWHGAYPRQTPGMRISIANYYRHVSVSSQEDIRNGFDRALADDCADPALFAKLAGFRDEFPYQAQSQPVPRVADR
ncbi:MAG: phytanoyl-CoA dioxygenase family protein [Pseudomonadota bacterium]